VSVAMIETSFDKNSGLATIVLRPNNSASWLFNKQIVASLAAIGILTSSYFAFQGLWLILPFTAIVIGGLFLCLYIRLRANLDTEIITFDENDVLIERGRYHAEKTWRYHRSWAKIFVRNPKIRGHPKQIFIRSHGKELELGAFLNKKDKELLIKNLKNIVYT
jgi:uncharacterized membrane protein